MELNQAQRLFKAFRATGLCPYVAEQAVRNTVETEQRSHPDDTQAMERAMEHAIRVPRVSCRFDWDKTPQGPSFWSDAMVAQAKARRA